MDPRSDPSPFLVGMVASDFGFLLDFAGGIFNIRNGDGSDLGSVSKYGLEPALVLSRMSGV